MDKSIQIGRHIFYRMQGGLGAASAFGRRYAGLEPAPISIAALPADELGVDLSGDGDAEGSGKPVDPIRGTGSSQVPLTADLSRGILVADDALPSLLGLR